MNDSEEIPIRERLRLKQGLLAELDVLDFALDLVVPDRESEAVGEDAGDFIVVGGGLRLILKLIWSRIEPESVSETHVLQVAQLLLSSAPDVDGVVLVSPPAPFPAVVVDAFAAGTAVEIPSGTTRPLPSGDFYPSVREALRHLIVPQESDWSGLPMQPLVRAAKSVADPGAIRGIAQAALQDLRRQGSRAHGEAKKTAWTALDDEDAHWATGLVQAVADAALRPDQFPQLLERRAGEIQ